MSRTIRLPTSGQFRVEIVGESYYQQNLGQICGRRKRNGEYKRVPAALILEAGNPNDPNAVRVDVYGKPVGYLSRADAVTYRQFLSQAHPAPIIGECPALIIGGWDRGKEDRGAYGVLLNLAVPNLSVRTDAIPHPAQFGSQGGGCLRNALIAVGVLLAVGFLFSFLPRSSRSDVVDERAPSTTAMAVANTPEPTPTPAPAATATPAPTDTPTPTPIPYASGGLGLSAAEMAARYGEQQPDQLPGFYRYGPLSVAMLDDHVWYIERQYDPPVPLATAQADWQSLLPADAAHVRTYQPEGRPETMVGLFYSPTLAQQYTTGQWVGGEPGNFTAQFNDYGQGVTRLILATGNNP